MRWASNEKLHYQNPGRLVYACVYRLLFYRFILILNGFYLQMCLPCTPWVVWQVNEILPATNSYEYEKFLFSRPWCVVRASFSSAFILICWFFFSFSFSFGFQVQKNGIEFTLRDSTFHSHSLNWTDFIVVVIIQTTSDISIRATASNSHQGQFSGEGRKMRKKTPSSSMSMRLCETLATFFSRSPAAIHSYLAIFTLLSEENGEKKNDFCHRQDIYMHIHCLWIRL